MEEMQDMEDMEDMETRSQVGRPLRGLRRAGQEVGTFMGKSERGDGGLGEASLPGAGLR
jgi:hypothetical protein